MSAHLLTPTDLSEESLDRVRIVAARVSVAVGGFLDEAFKGEGLTAEEQALVTAIVGTAFVSVAADDDGLAMDEQDLFDAILEAHDDGFFHLTEDEAADAGLI